MRLVNIWIGLAVFSLVMALMYGFAATINTNYGTDQETTYSELGVSYQQIDFNDTSPIRKVQEKAEEAEWSRVSAAVGAVDNVLEGIKLFASSTIIVNKVADQMAEDTEGIVDPLIPRVIKYLFAMVIVIITIATIWRFRPEA